MASSVWNCDSVISKWFLRYFWGPPNNQSKPRKWHVSGCECLCVRRLGGVVVRASDLWSTGCESDSWLCTARLVFSGWPSVGRKTNSVCNQSPSSIPPAYVNLLIEYQPVWLELKRGVFTCVGWQVTLCGPIPYGKWHSGSLIWSFIKSYALLTN